MQIPGYIAKHLIAEGGMASVYLAVQESLNREVALKLLKRIDDPVQSERFLNEGQVIASLNHRHVITIYDIGRAEGCHYISMEYLEGGDLENKIRYGVSVEQALDLVETLGDCLEFIHEHKIVHRDIKPANILFHKDGTPILTDFGVAKHKEIDANLTQENIALGSPYYLSPEQAESKDVDGRSDLYSLGVILFEMLAGHKPYDEESYMETIVAHLTQPVPRLPSHLSVYQELIERMMAKRPEDRFPSAASLVAYVQKLRQQTASDLSPVSQDSSEAWSKRFGGMTGARQVLRQLVRRLPGVKKQAARIMRETRDWFSRLSRRGQQTLLAAGAMLLVALIFLFPSTKEPEEGLLLQPSAATQDSQSLKIPERPLVSEAADGPDAVVAGSDRLAAPRVKTRQERIAAYLDSGDLALEELRLRVPQGNSAYYYYGQVLALDAENLDARKGITRVADKYADLVLAELDNADYEKAELYLNRGLEIQPLNERLQAIEVDRQDYLQKKRSEEKPRPRGLFDKLKSIFN